MNEEKTLIFLHIPRSGGSTLNTIIRRQFSQGSALVGIEPETQKGINRFSSLSEKDRAQIRYTEGHMLFGLHEYLPQPSTYITLLRDPVERVVSIYYHGLRTPGQRLHNELTSKNISLEDYARGGIWETWRDYPKDGILDAGNNQTRYLRGAAEGSHSPFWGPVPLSSNDLEIAKTNLRQHFMIGLTERFDESLILFKRTFGWSTRSILYINRHVGVNRSPKDDIASDTIKLIEKHNELDIQLYQFAKEIFEQQIQQQDSSFTKELQIFRLCNKIFAASMNTLGVTTNSKLYKVRALLQQLITGEMAVSSLYNKICNRLHK